jgi:Tfp pilus assembly protein PilF
VKPDYAEAHFNLAVIYATAKPPSIALAKRHYEKALELGAGPDKRLAAMLKDDSGS